MRTKKLINPEHFLSQETLDQSKNILIRFYQEQERFLFRFITISFNSEFDPMQNSALNWAYGPYTSLAEAEIAARNYYNEQKNLGIAN